MNNNQEGTPNNPNDPNDQQNVQQPNQQMPAYTNYANSDANASSEPGILNPLPNQASLQPDLTNVQNPNMQSQPDLLNQPPLTPDGQQVIREGSVDDLALARKQLEQAKESQAVNEALFNTPVEFEVNGKTIELQSLTFDQMVAKSKHLIKLKENIIDLFSSQQDDEDKDKDKDKDENQTEDESVLVVDNQEVKEVQSTPEQLTIDTNQDAKENVVDGEEDSSYNNMDPEEQLIEYNLLAVKMMYVVLNDNPNPERDPYEIIKVDEEKIRKEHLEAKGINEDDEEEIMWIDFDELFLQERIKKIEMKLPEHRIPKFPMYWIRKNIPVGGQASLANQIMEAYNEFADPNYFFRNLLQARIL